MNHSNQSSSPNINTALAPSTLSDDGRTLISADITGTILVWDVAVSDLIRRIPLHIRPSDRTWVSDVIRQRRYKSDERRWLEFMNALNRTPQAIDAATTLPSLLILAHFACGWNNSTLHNIGMRNVWYTRLHAVLFKRISAMTTPVLTLPLPDLASQFNLRRDIVFLNHGSFGACPRPVMAAYRYWQDELESEPVHFLDVVVYPF
jgi:hypothetical protein